MLLALPAVQLETRPQLQGKQEPSNSDPHTKIRPDAALNFDLLRPIFSPFGWDQDNCRPPCYVQNIFKCRYNLSTEPILSGSLGDGSRAICSDSTNYSTSYINTSWPASPTNIRRFILRWWALATPDYPVSQIGTHDWIRNGI